MDFYADVPPMELYQNLVEDEKLFSFYKEFQVKFSDLSIVFK